MRLTNNTLLAKKTIIFSLSAIVLLVCCKNDKKNEKTETDSFEVIIKTDKDINSLSMYPSMVRKKMLDSIYPSLFKGYLKDGTVSITGKKLPHPFMFDILEERKGLLSNKFFVDNCITEVHLDFENIDNTVNIPNKFKSKTQLEYEELKVLGLNEIDSLGKLSKTKQERVIIRSKRDSVIVNYIRNNPESYVPLWLMINYVPFSNERYNKLYDESLYLFSDEIKNTKLFKGLKLYINKTKNPISNRLLALKTLDLKPVNFKVNDIKDKKYILLDFWFTSCGPCLAEMPSYIPLYQKYKDMGFEIVSIASDKTSKIQDWKDTIKKRNFNWVHYLDENRLETTKLGISSFPTTYLIDRNGEILEKNITPEKLKKFLESKFKE